MGRSLKPNSTPTPSLKEIESSAKPALVGQPQVHITVSFDLSSTCVGWALGMDGELVTYGKCPFKTTATLGQKLKEFDDLVKTLLATYQPTNIVLEEPLKRAKVRNHFEFLGVLRLNWISYSGNDIPKEHLLDPRKIKKHLHVEPGRNHDHNKELMVRKINNMFRLALKYAKHSAYKSDDDIADAIAVLVTYWKLSGTNV